MDWRWKLGRAAGIDVFVHWTFVFLPLYIVLEAWHLGVSNVSLLLVLMFCLVGCVVLHEFGHALAGRAWGVATEDILITPIGGLARLHGLSTHHPLRELAITLAGPAVNLALAGVFAAYLWLSHQSFFPAGLHSFASILMWANLGLGLFNLVPAFPMDGGRILRSILSMFLPFDRATLVAGNLGRGLAIAFLAWGIYLGEIPLILVAFFVFFAAGAELQMECGAHSRTS